MASYKLADAYREIIHSPRSSGRVLYIPKPNGTNLNKQDLEFLSNKELMMHKNQNMNSPTNIKRIWMSYKHVVIEYYASPLLRGNKNGPLVYTKVLKNINILDIASKLLEYLSLEVSQRTFSKMEDIKLPGRALQALTYPYTLNNIEEIYIDWASLITDDAEIIMSQNGYTIPMILSSYLNGANIKNYWETDIPARLFVGPDKFEISKSYKRLKKIAMISNLDGIISTMEKDGVLMQSIETFNLNKPVTNSSSWMDNEIAIKYIKESKSDVWVSNLSNFTSSNLYDIKGDTKTFEIKSGQYLFDDQILRVKIEAYASKLKDSMFKSQSSMAKKEAEESARLEESPEGSIEQAFDMLIEKYGEAKAIQIIKLAIKHFVETTGQKNGVIFANMIPTKQAYYIKLLSK